MAEALKNRTICKLPQQQVKAAEKTLSAAHAERYPALTAEVDYGEIGVNPGNSYATLNATGKLSGPIFEEGKLRGDARIADAPAGTGSSPVEQSGGSNPGGREGCDSGH